MQYIYSSIFDFISIALFIYFFRLVHVIIYMFCSSRFNGTSAAHKRLFRENCVCVCVICIILYHIGTSDQWRRYYMMARIYIHTYIYIILFRGRRSKGVVKKKSARCHGYSPGRIPGRLFSF